MFTRYRTQAFILKRMNQGEADQLLTVYTKDFGKLKVLGKAIRKISSKLRPAADFFYLSEIEFIQAKANKTLTDAILMDKFENLRKDLPKLSLARRISGIFDRLIKGQEPDEKLWRLLKETFEKLNGRLSVGGRQLLYYYFLWNFLSFLGYQPELYHCSFCQKKMRPENIYFSLRKGGLVCSQCRDKTDSDNLLISANAVKIIRILLKENVAIVGKLKIESGDFDFLKKISARYLVEILKQNE
jgi:DNA repair protein RecO (recombination protein O)